MSRYVAPTEADRLRRAESRWLEQARERLRRPAAPARRNDQTQNRSEETDR